MTLISYLPYSLTMPHKILIVDDDDSIRFVLKKALSKEGYEVAEAKDGPSPSLVIASAPKMTPVGESATKP